MTSDIQQNTTLDCSIVHAWNPVFLHRIKNIKGTCDFIYTFLTFFLTILRQDINLKFSEENFVRYKNLKLPFKNNNNNKTELHNVKSEFSGKSLNCDIKI